MALWGWTSGAAFAAEQSLRIDAVACLAGDLPMPPAPHDPRWKTCTLPHVWDVQEQRGRAVWYRFVVPARADSDPPWALYLPQAHVNAALWSQGRLIADGGSMTDPMAFHWNQPFLLPLPRPMGAGDPQPLFLKVRAAGGFGLLGPVQAGPWSMLRDRYEVRRFWQAEIHGVFAGLLLSTAALALGIWQRRRADAQYLWLAVSCVAWSGFALFLYGREFWIDPLWMQWLAQNGTVWWVTGLAHYVHCQTGVRRVGLERLLIGLSVAFGVAAALLDQFTRVHVYSLGHVFALVTVSYLLAHTVRHWRRTRQRASLDLAVACAMVLLAGLHDVVLTMPVSWSSPGLVQQLQAWRFYLTPFGAPLASLYLAGHLARRFVATLAQFEALNAQLEQRVDDSRRALDRHYEARRELEREQAATQERERIVREMHDGIGGQLMTALRGVERGVFDGDKVAELLQESLDDLRLIIDASAATHHLMPALAGWRSRWDPRLEALGIELQWDIDAALSDLTFTPTEVLQLMRILQEAVINTVKHAQARQVRVVARAVGRGVVLNVQDDGRGWDGGAVLPGRHGLRSMQARAEAIGAQWSLRRGDAGGTTVEVSLARLSG